MRGEIPDGLAQVAYFRGYIIFVTKEGRNKYRADIGGVNDEPPIQKETSKEAIGYAKMLIESLLEYQKGEGGKNDVDEKISKKKKKRDKKEKTT